MSNISSTQLVVASAWSSRIMNALVSIYTLRVLSNALTPSEYATFIIMIGLSGWYALSDFGLGYATQNVVTRKAALGENAAGYVISAYILVTIAGSLIGLLTFCFSGHFSSLLLSKVPGEHDDVQVSRFWWSGLLLTIGAVSGMANKLLYAVHKGYVANVVTTCSSILGFVVLNAGLDHAGDRVIFAAVALQGPSILFSLLVAYSQIRKAFAVEHALRRADLIDMLRAARGFTVFNLMAAAVLQVDYIIMSQKVSPADIIQYYNIAKLFGFIAFFNQAIMFANWPLFTEKFAMGQFSWISKRIQLLVIYGVTITCVAAAPLMLFSGQASAFLSPGTPVEFRKSVIAGFAALSLVRCLTDPVAIFLQSIGKLRPLIVFAAAQAAISGLLQWVISDIFGIEGILIGIVLSFVITVAWGLPFSARRQLNPPMSPTAATNP